MVCVRFNTWTTCLRDKKKKKAYLAEMNKTGLEIVVCHSATVVSAVIVVLPFLHFAVIFYFFVATRYVLRSVAVPLYDFVSLTSLSAIKICELVCLLKARQLWRRLKFLVCLELKYIPYWVKLSCLLFAGWV